MKKLFWIPLFVILTVVPMIAGAAPVAGEPVAGNAGSPTATNTPKYALKDAGAGDEKAALASYVKGAYNAVIKGINNTQDEINTLNTGIETYSDAIGHLTDGKATKAGTVATIKSATTTESINTSSVQFNNVTTTSISATASGNVNLIVPIMDDWENDSLAETPLQTTASFTNLPVENLAMSAPTTNTATLTKTGITGNVDVSSYLASSAYTLLEYLQSTGTQYIDTGIKANSAYTYKFKVKRTSPYNTNIWGVKTNSSYSSNSSIILGWTSTSYIGVYSHEGSDTGINPSVVSWGTDYHTIEFNPTSKKLIIDGVDRWSGFENGCLTNENWSSNTYNLYLGGTNTVGSFVGGGVSTWAQYEVWNNNGVLIQNLIPVRRKSDNVLGMYDTVTGNFLTNAGTGEFIAGPELQ